MNLGRFSLSLPVKDMDASLDFYQKLGFKIVDGGHMRENFPDGETSKWRIVQHESVIVGLFMGMFPNTIMTFNPTDVVGLQAKMKAEGIEFMTEAKDEDGQRHAMLTDPDGNQILLDQH